MSTIKDVARRTGLSLSTISKYLNGGNVREENRLAIDAAIEELDYSVNVFARSLKANRSMTIGVLLPTISSPFFGRVVAAMEPVLRRSGYECFVCSYDFDREQELKKLEFLARYHVDGIVYVPENVTAGEVRARVGAIPVVLIDRSLDQADYDTVVVDNLNAVYMAIELLIGRGHRRIGLIAGPQTISTARAYRRLPPRAGGLPPAGRRVADFGRELRSRVRVAAVPGAARYAAAADGRLRDQLRHDSRRDHGRA